MNSTQLPEFITRYFWGDDLQQLDFSKNKKYILQTLLERGNQKAIQWLFSMVDRNSIKSMLPTIKLSKKSAHFWDIYLA
ncbi:MAG TPA: hypothetical protein VLG12_04410 [Candidatus Saccharimonadales bacterium]|nr:hypothetical protein [Candidatus Saccharimonadales bacterium]